GLDEIVELESENLFPMLKSSELTGERAQNPTRFMLVTQRAVGQETADIQHKAPKTWDYLTSHATSLDNRASSIYRNRPRFSIFGVGPYTFAPWKVAISGFYKRLEFTKVGSHGGKPILLDDTAYFLSCQTEREADTLCALLNSDTASAFFGAFIFWDSKRPITATILSKLNLAALAAESGLAGQVQQYLDQGSLS
ncbi:MAG: hypothetical protein N2C12_18855, partial [Planctomycetales bacterium]